MVTISPSIVLFAVGLLLLLYFLFAIKPILILLFLSFIVMVALNPVVLRLERKLRFPRVLAIVVVYLVVTSILAGLISLLIPQLLKQLAQLIKILDMPVVREVLGNSKFTLSELSTLVDRIGSSAGTLYSIVTSTFSGVFTFVTVLVMSFYLMLDRRNLHLKISWFTKNPEHIKSAEMFLDSLEFQLGGWVRGQLILMLTIGLVTYIGLTLLSVEYALPLALLAGMLEILPNLGPTLAAIPSIVVALITMGPIMAGVVTLFYILVQQFENNLLVPKIMKDNVDVNPLISILSILIGFHLAGVVGALLAIPIYIVLRSIYSTWFKNLILS